MHALFPPAAVIRRRVQRARAALHVRVGLQLSPPPGSGSVYSSAMIDDLRRYCRGGTLLRGTPPPSHDHVRGSSSTALVRHFYFLFLDDWVVEGEGERLLRGSGEHLTISSRPPCDVSRKKHSGSSKHAWHLSSVFAATARNTYQDSIRFMLF